ncbi:STAS/SEC14 domain-containing protein [Vannielia sp.]|uniref:STAS/SEC14 domain-containing protein n=1 Tax=Vannielia sp. TaxID=2813045 RepID=UPI002603EB62|nr:STAS/SEC14 domain-containing protein [Vannielia sp.]MDF1873747.1 STAS/SEC14 domain-containing protein [Vannielia sp.]
MSGHFDILTGYPPDVLAVAGHGKIDRACYEEQLIPAIKEIVHKEGKVKLLYILGADFEGFSAGAAWDDTKLGLLHLHDFARIALVTDKKWVRKGAKLFAPLMAAPLDTFTLAELEAAKEWIVQNPPPERNGGNVAADHRLLANEDKI